MIYQAIIERARERDAGRDTRVPAYVPAPEVPKDQERKDQDSTHVDYRIEREGFVL